MKIFKKILTYISSFILGGLFAVFLALTGISFLAVEALLESLHPSDSSSINPNVKEVLRLGAQYAKELEKVDAIRSQVESASPPDICKILCNPSNLMPDRFKDERSAYLAEYFSQSSALAIKDPIFNLRIEEMSLLGRLFPRQIRNIFIEVQQGPESRNQILKKIKLTLQIEGALILSVTNIALQRNDLKREIAWLQSLRTLKKDCNRGVSPVKIQRECENFAAH